MANKYTPKTKAEWDAYVAAVDAANAQFNKPPKKSNSSTSKKSTPAKKTGKK